MAARHDPTRGTERRHAVAAVLILATLISACSPIPTSGQDRAKDTAMPADPGTSERKVWYITDRAELLDADRQLYRFGDGICRELSKLPAPWRLAYAKRYEKPTRYSRFPAGYSSAPEDAIGYRVVTLEAEYADLGVAPPNTLPGTIERSGRYQDVAELILGPMGEWGLAGGGYGWITKALFGVRSDWYAQQPIPFKDRFGAPRIYVPVQSPFSVSDRFGVYAEGPKEELNDKQSLVIINPALQAGVYCYPDYDVPNPYCQGLIFLSEDESAKINVSYEALGKLQEVVESMIRTARAVRADCPISGEPS